MPGSKSCGGWAKRKKPAAISISKAKVGTTQTKPDNQNPHSKQANGHKRPFSGHRTVARHTKIVKKIALTVNWESFEEKTSTMVMKLKVWIYRNRGNPCTVENVNNEEGSWKVVCFLA